MTNFLRMVAGALLGVAAGCSVSTEVPEGTEVSCKEDGICPAGYKCRTGPGVCVPEGAPDSGFCGDGFMDADETCDDGNVDSGDGCSSDCQSDESCGNGIPDVDAGEDCDCGDGIVPVPAGCSGPNADVAGASCRTSCVLPGCGDGVIDPPEECEGDDLAGAQCVSVGFYSGSLACSAVCRFDTADCGGRCGDNALNGAEACDGAALSVSSCLDLGFYNAPGLACNPACGFDTSLCTGFCGDGVLNGPEICEDEPPANQSCASAGFEFGRAGCSPGCGLDIRGCRRVGWLEQIPPRSGEMVALHGTDRGNIWAGFYSDGPDNILYFDGSSWRADGSVPMFVNSIWAMNSNDVWAVGEGAGPSKVYRNQGSGWVAVPGAPTNDLNAVWGVGSVVFVGGSGGVTRFTGSSWDATDPTPGNAKDLWGSSPTDVYSATCCAVYHYDGTWSDITATVMPSGLITDIHGLDANNVWISTEYSALHFNGATWEEEALALGGIVTAIHAAAPDYVVAVTEGSFVHYFNGARWLVGAERLSSSGDDPRVLWGPDARYVLAGTDTGLLRLNSGATWRDFTDVSQVREIDGTASDAFFVLAGSTVYAEDGGVLNDLNPPAAVGDMWVAPTGEVFGVATSDIQRYNGTWSGLSREEVGTTFGLWGTSATNVYTFGAKVLHYNTTGGCGSDFCVVYDPPENVYDAWGSGPNDIHGVGVGCQLTHFNGTAWTSTSGPCPAGETLRAVWGSAPDDVFAVGDLGVILHYDGSTWTEMDSGITVGLASISGTGPADVFATGESVAIRYDGTSWSPFALPSESYARYVWAQPRLVMFGEDDIVGLRRPAFGTCEPAERVGCGAVVLGSTVGGEVELTDLACAPRLLRGAERTYRFASTASQTVNLSLSGTTDLALVVLGAESSYRCDPSDCVSASDTATDESLSFSASAGEDYYFVVDSVAGEEGGFSLSVTCP